MSNPKQQHCRPHPAPQQPQPQPATDRPPTVSWPTNDNGLSFAGVLKWIAIIASFAGFYTAYQGLIERQATSNRQIVTGQPAVIEGLKGLGWAAACLAIAWALWFFWQRNEDC